MTLRKTRMRHWLRRSTALRAGLSLAFLLGCGHKLAPSAPAQNAATVVALARARPIPALLRARFNVKLRSEQLDLAGSTGGGLVVARPGRGHLAVLGPLGSTLISFTSDGTGLAVSMPREGRHLLAEQAESVLREVTGGSAGLDDVLALLTGDLPFDASKVKSKRLQDDGSVAVVFAGPNHTLVEVVLDASTATLRSLRALDKQGEVLLSASYEPFEQVDGAWLPTKLALEVPALDLSLSLRYKSWKALDTAPIDFSIAAPEGVVPEDLAKKLLPPE